MIRLSAFADEISSDLHEQIAVLKSENIHFIDLRSVWNINVLDLSDQQVEEVKSVLAASDIQVAALASPIGKVAIDTSFEEHLQRFERALIVAQRLNTRYIRLFSFYPPASPPFDLRDPSHYRDEVLRRLRAIIARARAVNMLLLHENEKDIYGDTIERTVDLFQSLDDACWRSALDPANYLQCQQVAYPDAYNATRPWLEYIHVKDVRADGTLVPAGEGEARWPELLQRLRADGYDSFLALEPHLQAAGQFQGFSGPDLFCSASQALQQLLQKMNWQYA